MRRLILTYTLEPAGSHGVWGLDDHFFLPYIFGSAQLTRPVAPDEAAMPLEGSVPGAPEPADVVKPDRVERLRAENMYFSAIGFIYDVKSGPFWEHSPVLYNVSGIKDGWGKINKGMVKMFAAEVLGKFPVVQHFPFGSLFPWEMLPDAPASAAKPAGGDGIPVSSVTKAPGGGAPGYVTQRPRGNMPEPGAVPTGASGVRGNGARELDAARRPGGDTRRQPGAYSISRSGDPYLYKDIPRGVPGTASAQIAITKAPWKDVG
jgi:serine/threonine-protein phosphatase 2A activator